MSNWKRAIAQKTTFDQRAWNTLVNYRGRVELAHSFRNIELVGYTTQTRESYFVLFKIAFAYSALEVILELHPNKRIEVRDDETQSLLALGYFDKMIDAMVDLALSEKHNKTALLLKSYKHEGRSEDLYIFAKNIRNFVFHAGATPNRILLSRNKRLRMACLSLANSILQASDQVLGGFLDRHQRS